jgi:hypothetical protein
MIIIYLMVDYHIYSGYDSSMKIRHLSQNMAAALEDTPVILVSGARQTGKSTLCQSMAMEGLNRHYLTFDDPGLLAAARRDPNGFIAGLPDRVTLDEIQHIPELFPVIKAAVDRDRRPGRFLLTGSANVLLLPRLSESLAGRMEVLTLWPFSQGEMEGVQENFIDRLFSPGEANWAAQEQKLSRAALFERVLAGGYPPVLERKSAARRASWFESYVLTILQRDIRDLANIADLGAVPELLQLMATRAGSLLNFADLSRTAGIPQTTLKRYLTLLEATFLVQPLRPWARNLGKRLIQTPKVYLNDTGLLSHLLGMTTERIKTEGNVAGSMLENFVLAELRKQAAWSKTQPSIYFWRTASGQEVDVVLEDRAGRVVGIEIKAASTLGARDVSGLEALSTSVGAQWQRGVVLYTGDQIVPFGARLHGAPVSQLWAV